MRRAVCFLSCFLFGPGYVSWWSKLLVHMNCPCSREGHLLCSVRAAYIELACLVGWTLSSGVDLTFSIGWCVTYWLRLLLLIDCNTEIQKQLKQNIEKVGCRGSSVGVAVGIAAAVVEHG